MFGVAGLVMGAAYATGYAGSTAGQNADAVAKPVFGQGPTVLYTPSPYAGDVTTGDALAIHFVGQRGVIDNNVVLFKVDLSAESGAHTYFVDIYLNNYNAVSTTWESMQLKWLSLGTCAGAPAHAADADMVTAFAAPAGNNPALTPPFTPISASANPRIMNVTSSDAHVAWTGLAGGATYCYGILATANEPTNNTLADDTSANWLTELAPGGSPVMPTFTALVNRSA